MNRCSERDSFHYDSFPWLAEAAVEVMRGQEIQEKGREESHHWIARSSRVIAPRGYRSPIRLAGGSRLRVSDLRIVGLSEGHYGYRKPTFTSVGNGETQPSGPRAPHTAPGVPCDVEVE